MYIRLTCKRCTNSFRVFESDVEQGKNINCPFCKVPVGKELRNKIATICDEDCDFDVAIAPSAHVSIRECMLTSMGNALGTLNANSLKDVAKAFASEEEYKVVYAMISGALMGYHNQLRENLLVYGIDVGDLK